MEWLHPALIGVHATAGGVGLLLAGPVMLAPKRRGRHPVLGRVYAISAGVLCLTAFGLVAYDPARLAGLAVLGTLTAVWVGGGVWLARRRPVLRGGPHAWRIWHLNLMGSSVISFVTAFLVQITQGSLVAWIAPTVVGTLIITAANIREQARRAARPSPAGPAAPSASPGGWAGSSPSPGGPAAPSPSPAGQSASPAGQSASPAGQSASPAGQSASPAGQSASSGGPAGSSPSLGGSAAPSPSPVPGVAGSPGR
jgi:hypothetical protein